MPSLQILASLAIALVVGALWAFPSLWYNRPDATVEPFWLDARPRIPGWRSTQTPVSRQAEAILVADTLFSAEFRRADHEVVRTFSAGRTNESGNEIGLFAHTPDRCWVESGWRLLATEPEEVEVRLHGTSLRLERRVFEFGDNRELVYFGGLIAGQPPPYRLDHNLSVGLRQTRQPGADGSGTLLRASDGRFWGRIWETFRSRRPLFGPKQFVRVSTRLVPGLEAQADALLREFLPLWLDPLAVPGARPGAPGREPSPAGR